MTGASKDIATSHFPARIRSAEELGRLFRAERRRQGLTLEVLYSVTGLSTRFLSEFERGKPHVSITRALVALQALGLEALVLSRGDAQRFLTNRPAGNGKADP